MTARIWLPLSLLANLLTVGALVVVLGRRPVPGSGPESAPVAPGPAVSLTPRAAPAVPARTEAAPADDAQIPRLWNRIEVADYKQYAENLRALGMPESLVRDIVVLDLMRSFGERVSEVAHETRPPFWQANSFRWKSRVGIAEVAQAVADFRQTSLDALGIEPSRWLWDQVSWMAQIEQSGQAGLGNNDRLTAPLESLFEFAEHSDGLEWLPRERADGLMTLRASFAAREAAIEARRTEANTEAIDAELAKLNEEREAAETAYLTPAERRERELRSNGELIQALAGVDLSREEFETLSTLAHQDEAGEAWRTAGTPEQAQALALLGHERYDEILRGYDPAYQSFLRACKDADLPPSKAADLLVLQRQYDTAIAGRTTEEAEPLRMEALRAAQKIVGDDAFESVSHWVGSQFRIPAETATGEAPSLEITAGPGMTVESIARMYGIDAAELARSNNLDARAPIATGRRITLPLPAP